MLLCEKKKRIFAKRSRDRSGPKRNDKQNMIISLRRRKNNNRVPAQNALSIDARLKMTENVLLYIYIERERRSSYYNSIASSYYLEIGILCALATRMS